MNAKALALLASPYTYPIRAIASIALMVALVLLSITPLLVLGEEATFMHFADHRMMFGLKNAADVLSNFGFLIAGALGLRAVGARHGTKRDDRTLHYLGFVVFGSVLATAFGSPYFHLNPNHESLLWDRLPMAIGFAGLVSLLIADRISARAGRWSFAALAGFALWSISMWQVFEFSTPYSALQAGSLVAVVLIAWLHPKGRLENRFIWLASAGYLVAKLFEVSDAPLYELTGFVSGHSLKHVMAALAIYALAAAFEHIDRGVSK
ncbi:MAG: hypothetical protein V4760_16545 [Bdellovibrionota bacterium]